MKNNFKGKLIKKILFLIQIVEKKDMMEEYYLPVARQTPS